MSGANAVSRFRADSGPQQIGSLAPRPKPTDAAATAPDFEVSDEGAPIPEGEYVLGLDYWETALMFGRCAKVVCWFTVLAGPHKGARLARFYNAERLTPPMGKAGRFQVRRGCDFTREFSTLSAAAGVQGSSLAALRGIPVKGIVRTVSKTASGAPLNGALSYSVVAKLTGAWK